MATNILMPALSPTMTEGTLARWLKKEGDPIKAGDVIAEIETDKATMEVEAVDEGVLGKILVPDGTANVAVNAPIAVLVEAGEAVPAGAPAASPAPAAAPSPAPAAASPVPAPSPAPGPVSVPASGPASGPAATPVANGHDSERVFASPLARRMAKQAGIDLGMIRGTGPNGRIVRADVEAAQKGGAAARAPGAAPPAAPSAAPAPALAPAPAARGPAPAITAPHKLVPHSSMRKVIARRLAEAKSTIPHFYVSMDIELDAMIAIQEQLNARAPAKDQPGAYFITINDVVIKATAAALRRVPEVNASWTDDGMVFYDDVDISVAVAIPDGLITPIIRKADQKGLLTISREMRDLAARARAGRLKPEEFQGGGFSISNMGMFGVSEFAAIINPPQAAILAVATGAKRPVVKNGALAVATVMTCTLSVDHRVIDGALGARWLKEFKAILEDPLSLML
ncbi:pyruvate dehydrogenase complex dihydrolipoamide acetyltransferase [Rhodopila sp.]|jgi:pyruvate dehydrogenase E2 component (dihydrolipoamide acetyltransferase)|uniref:pyruvate dehydrogenase complex dihydrolipoamide acetyltransferase n=1 Tax=Rhodopila sp. TaxID=2480087 RepID=UPI002BE4FC61|nr:pyruvate dehydrogenase complex dihydrolipoamide acetyltransferase [Rhodopila sp.]HVZ09791.1 pyruvate dehydrogenase complex dihydrolipoamide acetyltransferase [Rhodopila sp.]